MFVCRASRSRTSDTGAVVATTSMPALVTLTRTSPAFAGTVAGSSRIAAKPERATLPTQPARQPSCRPDASGADMASVYARVWGKPTPSGSVEPQGRPMLTWTILAEARARRGRAWAVQVVRPEPRKEYVDRGQVETADAGRAGAAGRARDVRRDRSPLRPAQPRPFRRHGPAVAEAGGRDAGAAVSRPLAGPVYGHRRPYDRRPARRPGPLGAGCGPVARHARPRGREAASAWTRRPRPPDWWRRGAAAGARRLLRRRPGRLRNPQRRRSQRRAARDPARAASRRQPGGPGI